MASLLIRNVDDALRAQLKARAHIHGRSLEEEVRETLRTAMANEASASGRKTLLQIATAHFGPERGVELDLARRDADGQRNPPDFGGAEYDR
jgi:plasmid stability protein